MSDSPQLRLTVDVGDRRIDAYVADHVDSLSRSRASDLIRLGSVRIRGRTVRPSQRVQSGDEITVDLPDPTPLKLTPEPIPLTLVYEDDDLAVVDKPAGLAVHPAPGHREHTLVQALLARFPELPGVGGALRPGIVHRLDLDTSGLLVVAKSDRGQAQMADQFASRGVQKGYLALVGGHLDGDGVVEAPIGRHPTLRKQMAIIPNGRLAVTRFHVIERFPSHSFLLALPLTGRTHQIRVHLAGLGHPVAGDALYGGATPLLPRQFLHAAMLRFRRPADGAVLDLRSPVPADLFDALSALLLARGITPAEAALWIERMVELSVQYFHRAPVAPSMGGRAGVRD